jgi:hypothetical protein
MLVEKTRPLILKKYKFISKPNLWGKKYGFNVKADRT